jgi:hypothetical protein
MNGDCEYSERTPFFLAYFEYLSNGCKAYNVSAMKDPKMGKFRENTLIVTDNQNNVIYGDCHDAYDEKRFTYSFLTPLRRYGGET